MFGFFAKTAAKCGAKCIPGLNVIIITAEVAGAAWTIYEVGKNISEENNRYRRG